MTVPNILFIMADQLAPHFTSTYGHPVVRTPHLDSLAENGARFDAAYCHSPLCAPARFTMLAGQSVAKIGAWDNAAEFPASTPTIAHYLGLAGYRTILSGKMHFIGPDQLHGFNERLTTDIYPADFAWTPNWDQATERIDRWYHNMDVLQDAGPAVATYQIDYDEEVGYAARRRLMDLARDDGDQPFFMVASFIHPHDPYVARPEWWNLYDGHEIDLPLPLDLVSMDPHTERIRRGIEAHSATSTDDQVRNARRGYFANTSYFDSWIGKLISTLEETDELENTVIVITSDHGDMLGDRGAWFKMSFHERSARVPLIISGPGVNAGTIPGACSHLDLLPTLLDIATDGQPWPTPVSNIEGRSLWAVVTGGTGPADETTAEYCAEMTSHPMFMIRRGRFKYIHCDTDPPLLFDLTADPDERTNLATDPGHSAVAVGFADEVQKRWNSNEIRDRVIESQHTRHLLYEANKMGPLVSWDYLPPRDVANSYVRNHHHWAESGPKKRYPRT